MKKESILLIGPKETKRNYGYGGGAGGYVANLRRYETLLKDHFNVNTFYLSSRNSKYKLLVYINFPLRFFFDLIRFIYIIKDSKNSTIHLLGQYRTSVYRELFIVLLAKIFSLKSIYDIRAGAFINTYNNSNFLYKFFVRSIIKLSDNFLVESLIYKKYLAKKFKRNSYYLPNFLPYDLVKNYKNKLKQTIKKNNYIDLLYVGNCSSSKGLNQLIEATDILSKKYKNIKLNLVGNIEEEIVKSKVLTKLIQKKIIIIYGVLSPEKIYDLMIKSTIYVYPSMHKGEGHNNSINEAACFEFPVITTRNGFLSEAFSNNEMYFLKNYNPVNPKEIVNMIKKIINYPEEAKNKTTKAKNKIIEKFTSKAIINNLLSAYKPSN